MMCIKRAFLSVYLLTCALATPAHALAPVQEITTKDGLKLWLIEDHTLPLVTIRVAFREAGTASDEAKKQGRARMAASLLDEGAGPLDALGFATARDTRAIRWNARVDDDLLVASVQAMTEHKDEAAKLLGLGIHQPRFDDVAIARIKAQMLAALARANEDPSTIAANALGSAAFGEHPYGRPSLGTKEGIEAVTRGDLQAYVRTRLVRESMLVSIVGDVTAAEAKTLAENYLSAAPKEKVPAPIAETTLPLKESTTHLLRDVPQTVVLFAGPGLKRSDKDYLTAFVLNEVVGGGGLNSRLSEQVREQRGLAYSIGSDLDPKLHAGVLAGGFATRGESAQTAITVLRDTLRDVRDKGITPEELAEAKQFITGAFALNLDSQSELASYLTSMQLHGLGRDYLEKRNRLIEAVTLEDANRVAKTLFDPERLTLVSVGKTPAKENTSGKGAGTENKREALP